MDEKKYNRLLSVLLENNTMLKKLVAERSKELLPRKNVLEMLHIGDTTYQRYVDNKVFTQIKIEGKAYVQRAEIERLIEEGKV